MHGDRCGKVLECEESASFKPPNRNEPRKPWLDRLRTKYIIMH